MKLHEYQAKEFFSRYGIPIPAGQVASTATEAQEAASSLEGSTVIKAQVHACRQKILLRRLKGVVEEGLRWRRMTKTPMRWAEL